MINNGRQIAEKSKNNIDIGSRNYKINIDKINLHSQYEVNSNLSELLQTFYRFKNSTEVGFTEYELKNIDKITKYLLYSNKSRDAFIKTLKVESVQSIFESIDSLGLRDKKKTLFLLEVIYQESKANFPWLMNLLGNFCAVIISSTAEHKREECVFCIKLFLNQLKFRKNNDFDKSFYTQFIIPLIAKYGVLDVELVYTLLNSITLSDTSLLSYTLSILVRYFVKQNAASQSNIGELLSRVLIVDIDLNQKDLADNILKLVVLGLSSNNFQVLDSFLDGFLLGCYDKLLKTDTKTIFGTLFELIYKVSKKHWKVEQRIKSTEVLGILFRLNMQLFEDCLVEYNKQRFVSRKDCRKSKHIYKIQYSAVNKKQ